MGAQWIHGVDGNPAYDLALEAGIVNEEDPDGDGGMEELFDWVGDVTLIYLSKMEVYMNKKWEVISLSLSLSVYRRIFDRKKISLYHGFSIFNRGVHFNRLFK